VSGGESMRHQVIREPLGYSVIDSWRKGPDRRVDEFTGKTARARAWAKARKLDRESDSQQDAADYMAFHESGADLAEQPTREEWLEDQADQEYLD
jgi:hypothetical protein